MGAVIVARAFWVIVFQSNVALFRLGLSNPAGIDGYLAELILGLPIVLLVPVFTFAAGYLIAGLLLITGRWWAGIVYLGALLIDAGVWVFMTTVDEYRFIYSGNAGLVDLMFNLFDFSVLMFLVVWGLRERRRALG
ncbi:MAG: hypothetical protein GYB36_02095 [Alphaproteobacteria bacterium]|nr:hypothetical protein [Alphaproteobacteria bacterium]